MQPGQPKVLDRADGVKGHICVGRRIEEDKPYYEFYIGQGSWSWPAKVYTGKKRNIKRVMDDIDNGVKIINH